MHAVSTVWPQVQGSASDFNLGMNDGGFAGQTVPHVHLHLIPRREGDTPNPAGGVRGVIPDRRDWRRFREYPPPPREPLFVGPPGQRFSAGLLSAFDTAIQVDIAVAFLTESGISLIEGRCRDILANSDGWIRIVTGDYLDFNEPCALRRLLELGDRLFLYVHESSPTKKFHAKSYLFRDSAGRWCAFIGSSNLTHSALQENIEWNARIDDHIDATTVALARQSFEKLLANQAVKRVDDAWIDAYEQRRVASKPASVPHPPSADPPPEPEPVKTQLVEPHAVQVEALAALRAARADGKRAGLVVMATGLGKTILAALHRKEFADLRCLFIAHREEILSQALDAFRRVDPELRATRVNAEGTDCTGSTVFGSIQTLSRKGRFTQIPPDHFDLIVVDEFHHAAAPSYRRVLDHFSPKYLLGLTATPDRTDQGDILALCQDNLVYQCDLFEAIKRTRLSPFDYFGIADLVDYDQIPWRNGRFDPETLGNRLATETRAGRAFDEWVQRIGPSRPTMAFCASISHADFMRDYFQQRDPSIRCAAVHGGLNSDHRSNSLERLREGSLDVLFSVDMLNEGVDVPEVEGVLMLRPTTSPVLFLQQLGRGLRLRPNKRLQIVDFVGNHRSFLTHVMTVLDIDSLSDFPPGLTIGTGGEQVFELPGGCRVHYELNAIDLIAKIKAAQAMHQGLEDWYKEHCERTGRRPSFREAMRREFYGPGGAARDHAMGSWAGVLARNGALATVLGDEHSMAREVLNIIQTTRMTRSFKMLVLEVFAEELLPASISIERIAAHFRNRADQDARIAREIDCDLGNPRALRRYLLENPVHAWTTPNGEVPLPLFTRTGDALSLNRQVGENVKPELADAMIELVEAKLWAYFNRPRHVG